MLETASLPILLKAVDFLFDECKKIMEERREKRKPAKAEPAKPASAESAPPALPAPPVIQTREAALRQPVRPEAWSQAERQVNHLLELLEIHQENRRMLRKQAAQWGEALTPLIIVNSLRHEETQILEIGAELQTLLSELYAQKVQAIPPEDLEPQI